MEGTSYHVSFAIKLVVVMYIAFLIVFSEPYADNLTFMNSQLGVFVLAVLTVLSLFYDTVLFILMSIAFIGTLVYFQYTEAYEYVEDNYDIQFKPKKENDYVNQLERERKTWPPNTPIVTPKPIEKSEATSEGKEHTSESPRPRPPTPTPTPTPTPIVKATPKTEPELTPKLNPATLVSKCKTSTTPKAETDQHPLQIVLDKYSVEEMLEKASSAGVIKENANKYLHPLGLEYNAQGVTEDIVGYNIGYGGQRM